ncbi:hypothetical protein [Nocardioides sp.]|uniref:hypothetical protein n=1 Tax=Nocardioides sp. TaxID=35761 RepID=UPI0039E5354F
MSSITVRHLGRGAAAVIASALGLSALAVAPAQAGPGGVEGPGCTVANGTETVYITSATTLAKGTTVSFVGTDFVGSAGVFPTVYVKFDAESSSNSYAGTATSVNGTAGAFQVQGDGSVSGSITIPDDIDDATVNPFAEGPHFLRVLGQPPAVSCYSDDFEVAADAATAPVITAVGSVSSGRSGSNAVVTVNATGFEAGESVTVTKANDAANTVLGTLTADASGAITNSTITAAVGTTLPAGDWQLIFNRADSSDAPGIAQVTVPARVAITGAALDTDATITITNAQPGAVFGSVTMDPNSAVEGDDVTVSTGAITADASGAATGTIHVPDGAANLGTKTFTAKQTQPYGASYTVSAKVSPSTATFGTDKFDVISTADGAILDGLYQTAYNATTQALYATTAYQTDSVWDGTLYKLDPATLAVLDSERAPLVPDVTTGARLAPYGVGVDADHDTVWVTNTRQNTVSVYDGTTLDPIYSAPVGSVSHSRDVLYDPGTQQVYVTSASEGTSGEGYISVFEADDLDGDGTKYEKITDIATGARTVYSPMSLELDVDSHTLFSPSLSSQQVAKVDTTTNTVSYITVDGIVASGRGASGIAYDKVTNRLFIASQNTDELVIADADTGATLSEIPTGAGALNVAFDPVNRLAYVANFGGSTITVVDPDGNKVANLPYPRTNHVHEDGKGNIFAVDKNSGNHVWKLSLKSATTTTDGDTTTPVTSTVTDPKAEKVKKIKAQIKKVKAQIKKAKKAHQAAKVKKLKKRLAKLKKKLKKAKKQLQK